MRLATNMLVLLLCGCSIRDDSIYPPGSRLIDAYELDTYYELEHQWINAGYEPPFDEDLCNPAHIIRDTNYDPDWGFWGMWYVNHDGVHITLSDYILNTHIEKRVLRHEFIHHLLWCAYGHPDGDHSEEQWNLLNTPYGGKENDSFSCC